MPHTIEISDDSVDAIFRDILVNDYLHMRQDINLMETRVTNGEELQSFELEDLSNWIKTVAAFDILLDYYFVHHEANDIRDRAKRG